MDMTVVLRMGESGGGCERDPAEEGEVRKKRSGHGSVSSGILVGRKAMLCADRVTLDLSP
jgi:hypothetical protein